MLRQAHPLRPAGGEAVLGAVAQIAKENVWIYAAAADALLSDTPVAAASAVVRKRQRSMSRQSSQRKSIAEHLREQTRRQHAHQRRWSFLTQFQHRAENASHPAVQRFRAFADSMHMRNYLKHLCQHARSELSEAAQQSVTKQLQQCGAQKPKMDRPTVSRCHEVG